MATIAKHFEQTVLKVGQPDGFERVRQEIERRLKQTTRSGRGERDRILRYSRTGRRRVSRQVSPSPGPAGIARAETLERCHPDAEDCRFGGWAHL